VRIGGVRVHRHAGPAFRIESLLGPPGPRELLQLALGRRPVLTHPPRRLLRDRLQVRAQELRGARLRRQLLGVSVLSNSATSSALETISGPIDRTSSSVPPSIRATVGISLRGE